MELWLILECVLHPRGKTIKISDILSGIGDVTEYKIHFAKHDKKAEPLDVYLAIFADWKGWNSWIKGKNEFNRRYIFSLINF